ncbi:MAG TPA: CPBP family intramembrane metalloprotease [Methyloprofundus sp.]|uniref:CPBP family glutamic-type intramembrane protease n=1 Tax=Methyloprofundus sp. TaxID=2020875 RepID=UPI00182BB825|nr:CPBP family glutamic-type intramembrane protease [Methyloprofundus sp.]HIG65390.1 CPBP family intramembrane metalloprotease [Methyloprofundus sp.]HIL77818.1 CPBP family intramembrane metalloprotease [Methylococcales bacterium]
MLNKIQISLIPLFMLFIFSIMACFIGYGIYIGLDGAIELSKIISKFTQVLLVLSIYPVMRWLKISASDMGFVPVKAFLKQMLGGMVLGLMTLLPVLLLSYALGIIEIDVGKVWSLDKLAVSLLVAFLLALLISLLEEPMFRGVLISAYVKRLGINATIFVSSFYYAALHFIKTKTSIPFAQADLSDSFMLLFQAVQHALNPEHLGAFWALFMVGFFLAVMRTHLKLSLAWVIGCHTAWVWQIKMAHKITEVNHGSELLYLISPYDGVIGPMVAIWLTVVLCVYLGYRYLQQKKC